MDQESNNLMNDKVQKLIIQNPKNKFEPMTLSELVDILGLTIKSDEVNKTVTFLCHLSAYTENSQFNISFNAPSSTGKSFIPLEISNLFPPQDLIKLGSASPTAFFHEQGEHDKETNTIKIDLSRKILIFLDQQNNGLPERLRSLFSHDQKEMQSKITDKNQKGSNRTKTVIIKGYPSVIFCSAGLTIDEQEATRFLLLSPEVNQEKIRKGVYEKFKKEANNEAYKKWLEQDPRRKLLKERILAIRSEEIDEINIQNPEAIFNAFVAKSGNLKPRHQRDAGRLLSLVKSLALLNLWWRDRPSESTIIANDEDIDNAFQLWETISVSQELNIPPYVLGIYQEVILPLWEERAKNFPDDRVKQGLTRQDIPENHYKVYGRMIDNNQLRMQILPMLETAGQIIQEQHPDDRRKLLIYPILPFDQTNSDNHTGLEGESVGSDSPVKSSGLAKG